MGSFAIFTDKTSKEISTEVHFNLWNQNGHDDYLDIGVMLSDVTETQSIYVWVPFKIDSHQVNDLKTALENIDVINAIFNENYTLQKDSQSKWVYLRQNDTLKFKIYLLECEDIAVLSPDSLGFQGNENASILKIDIVLERLEEIPIYLRFRIELPEETEIIHEYSRPYRWIRGAFSKNYVIDFRYNDKRSFSTSENAKINANYRLSKTTKLHFLLMTKVYVDVECSTDVRKRRLEPNVWKKYVLKDDTTDIIAYHATKKDNGGDIGSWDFFAKQTLETEDWKLLLVFLVITVLLSALGSQLSNFLDDLF